MSSFTKILGAVLVLSLGVSLYGTYEYRTRYKESVQEYNELETTYSDLHEKYDELQEDHTDLVQRVEDIQIALQDLQGRYESLQKNYSDLQSRYSTLQEDYTALQSSYTQKEEEHNELKDKYEMLQQEYNELQEEYAELEEEYTFSNWINPSLFTPYISKVSVYNSTVEDLAEHLGAGESFLGRIDTTFRYVAAEITYTQDPAGREIIQSPIKTYQLQRGDCEDQAIFLACLLKLQGYRVRLNFVDRTHTFDDLETAQFKPNHVTVSVHIPEEYQKGLIDYTYNKKYYLHGDWLWLEPTGESYIGFTDEIYPFVHFEA